MNPQNRPRRKKIPKRPWQIPLLIVLVILLAAALGLVLWLSRPQEAPAAEEMQTAAESGQAAAETADSAEESEQAGPAAPETEPQSTAGMPNAQGSPGSQGSENSQGSPGSQGSQNSQGSPNPSNQSGSSPGQSADPNPGTAPEPTAGTQPPEEVKLTFGQYSLYSGQFVEDGRDELVSNVAAILVTNVSDQFLDLANITFDIDGQTAEFVVTGLPAGRSAWVLESSRMTAADSSVFTYVDMTASFRDDVSASSGKVSITSDGNMLTATNNSGQTLEGVFIYYRTVHTDGNFLGGITYLVDFGTLAPGASAQKLGGHYSEDSEIIRIGWLE